MLLSDVQMSALVAAGATQTAGANEMDLPGDSDTPSES
jgi:hypothetical protein